MKPWRTALSARWQQLQARERVWVALACAVVVLALLWLVAVAPALRTLRAAPAQHQQLDATLQRMQQQQRLARQRQAQATPPTPASPRSLEESVQKHLGFKAKLEITGQRAQVSVQGVSSSALAHWLQDLRENAHAEVQQAHLERADAGNTALWRGSITLTLARP
jgi:general secretion pathway protein M